MPVRFDPNRVICSNDVHHCRPFRKLQRDFVLASTGGIRTPYLEELSGPQQINSSNLDVCTSCARLLLFHFISERIDLRNQRLILVTFARIDAELL